jgi:hypothetical protein
MPSEPQQRVIAHGVRELVNPVTLLYYTPDVPSTATAAERALLEAIGAASDRVHLEVLAEQWDGEREAKVGIARTPATAVRGAEDYGIRYYGTPDGYELETFLAIIRAVSEGRSGLSEASRAAVRALTEPLHLEVLVAPT